MGSVELVENTQQAGGENGIGLADLVENRLGWHEVESVYETPGGTILYHAHEVLETITLDKETARVKQYLASSLQTLSTMVSGTHRSASIDSICE